MNAIPCLKTAAWVSALTIFLGTQSALAEPLVYVPMGGEDRIVVIDAATDEVVGTIAGTPAVHGLAGTPDGRFLIAGSYEEREAGTAAPDRPAGVAEDDHEAHHGGSTAVGATRSVVSTVSVIRTDDASVVRRIDVPGAVHHVAVSPDGRFAVVTRPNEGGISVIDLASWEVTANLPTGPLSNYANFSPDGHRLYVSNAGNDTVSEIDAERWNVIRNLEVGESPGHMVLSQDGRRLYVANVDDGTVSEVATTSGSTVQSFDIGEPLHGIDLSDDGQTLYVAFRGGDQLVGIELATGASRSAPLDPEPYHLAAIRGGGKLYVSSAGEPRIQVVEQKTLSVLREIPVGGRGHQIVRGAGG